MTVFERTAAGQTNRASFYSVDLICYVEGEDQSDCGDDVFFWHLVFSTLRPDISVKFLSRGGKPQLEALARETVANDVGNVLVAMDADYSRFFAGRMIEDTRIFYTYGYSWENDVFSPGADRLAFPDATRSAGIPKDAVEFLVEGWDRNFRDFGRLVIADFTAFRCGSSVIDARKPGQFIGRSADGRPVLIKERTLHLIGVANATRPTRHSKACIDKPNNATRYLKGRLVALACRLNLISAINKFSGTKQISDAHFRQICLAAFRERLRAANDDPIAVHHRQQVARL